MPTLPDLLAAFHLALVAFVVLGEAAILAGGWRTWAWVRNRWFRLAHLAVIVVVALEAVFGVLCPLTRWEYDLRVASGEGGRPGTFVGRLIHAVLYYDFPPWVFTVLYVGFAALVLATLWLVPPRWRGTKRE
jgi:hypothetical protein